MATRHELEARIDAYAQAVRDKNPEAVAALFANRVDHIVHGAGDDPTTPWDTKREHDPLGIKQIYTDFFAQAGDMSVTYTDRVIDTQANAAAVIVRVVSTDARMENALHLKWNTAGKIIFFHNWYGCALD